MEDTNKEEVPVSLEVSEEPAASLPSAIDDDAIFYGQDLIHREEPEEKEEPPILPEKEEDTPIPPCPYCHEPLIKREENGEAVYVHEEEITTCHHQYHSLEEIEEARLKKEKADQKIAKQPESYKHQICPICGKPLYPTYDEDGDLSYFSHSTKDYKNCTLLFSNLEKILEVRKNLYGAARREIGELYRNTKERKGKFSDEDTLVCPYCHGLLYNIYIGGNRYYGHKPKHYDVQGKYKDLGEILQDNLCQAVFRDASDVLETWQHRKTMGDTSKILLCPVCHEPLEAKIELENLLFTHTHSSCHAFFKEPLSKLEKCRWKQWQREKQQMVKKHDKTNEFQLASLGKEHTDRVDTEKDMNEIDYSDRDITEEKFEDVGWEIPAKKLPWYVRMFQRKKE